MKIVFTTLGFLPDQVGGGEVYAYLLAKRFQELGHEVRVLRRAAKPSDNFSVEKGEFEGIKTCALRTRPPVSAWAKDDRIYTWAYNFFTEQRPDVVHVFLFAGMLSVVEAAKKCGIPIIMTALDFGMFCARFHLTRKNGELCDGLMVEEKCIDCLLESYSNKLQVAFKSTRLIPDALLTRVRDFTNTIASSKPLQVTKIRTDISALKKSWSNASGLIDLLIAPSEIMKRMYLLNGFPENGIRKSVYGVTGPAPGASTRKPIRSGITFGYVGRLHPSKGIDVLIDAFKGIENKDIRLELYGPITNGESYSDRIKELAETDSRIQIRGTVTQAEIGAVHERIDVLVVPSLWYENAPLTVLESLRYNTPVICSDVDGITEFIVDGKNGLVFRRNDTEGLRTRMLSLLRDGDLLPRLKDGTRGIKSVEENVEEILGFYSSVISQRSNVGAASQDR